jgi:hypothetical protein
MHRADQCAIGIQEREVPGTTGGGHADIGNLGTGRKCSAEEASVKYLKCDPFDGLPVHRDDITDANSSSKRRNRASKSIWVSPLVGDSAIASTVQGRVHDLDVQD